MPGWSEFADPSSWTWVAGADTRPELKVAFDKLAAKQGEREDETRIVTWREDPDDPPETKGKGGGKGGKGKGGKGERRQRGGKGKGGKGAKGGKGGNNKGRQRFEWAAVSPLNSAVKWSADTDTWMRAPLPSMAPRMTPLSSFDVTSGARAEKVLIEELGEHGISHR